MNDCAVVCISHYTLEAYALEQRLLSTEAFEFGCQRQFCLSALRHILQRPLYPLHHCHAVLLHGTAETIYLSFVLMHEHLADRRLTLEWLAYG